MRGKRMRLLVNTNVKSVSNAITNSSSEVFLVKSERPSEDVKELILAFSKIAWEDDKIKDRKFPRKLRNIITEDKLDLSTDEYEQSSGMGGDIDVTDFNDAACEYKKFYRKDIGEELKKKNLTEEELSHYVLVDIDWARRKTIQFIQNNFIAYNCDIQLTEKEENIYEIMGKAYLNRW